MEAAEGGKNETLAAAASVTNELFLLITEGTAWLIGPAAEVFLSNDSTCTYINRGYPSVP